MASRPHPGPCAAFGRTAASTCLKFAGGQHELSTRDGTRRGSSPCVARAPDGRMVMVYEGTADHRLFYVTGTLNNGVLTGQEYSLTQGSERRGSNPSIAISGAAG